MAYVIIGNSCAGISAALGIRQLDFKKEIIIISEEATLAYYRPLIPLIISGEKKEEEIAFKEKKFYKDHKIRLIRGVRASQIVPEKKLVILADGKEIFYERLLIASGASAIQPPLEGGGEGKTFILRSLKDALAIKAQGEKGKKALILGGGLIGIKAALALLKKGLKVTVVEKMEQILYPRVDFTASKLLEIALKELGIKFILGQSLIKILSSRGKVKGGILEKGSFLEGDLVVLAVGVRPNKEIAQNCGIKTNQGILVDEYLETSLPGIFAAGDVAETFDLVSRERIVSALWTNAAEMGRFAGYNLTGQKRSFPGVCAIMNAVEIAGMPIISVGIIQPKDKNLEEIVQQKGKSYRKLVFKEDILVGILLINEIEKAGIYTNLIKHRIPLGSLKKRVIEKEINYGYFSQFPSLSSYLPYPLVAPF